MKAYPYIPFQGELEELKGPELAALRDISEGWYVDYKESAPSPRDLAKHLSAFANQYGGWLFLGIKETAEKGMTAGSFPGVSASSVPSILVSLRESSSAHSSPPFFFETKVIYGPVSELGLSVERAIIIVGVPEGTNPPYIHSSGRIYRRVADQSDPKPETDRHVLDLLWERGARTRQRLEDFLVERTILSKGEKNGPVHAYVYFLADPHFVGHQFPLPYSDFVNVMQAFADPSEQLATVPFSNNFTTTDGFIARQTAMNDPLNEVLTFRWWRNGNVRVSIPVNVHNFIESQNRLDSLQLEFLRAIGKQGFKHGRIGEFSLFLVALTSVAVKYLHLRKILGITGPFFGKVRLCETWRVIPYINLPSYLKAIEAHGFPVLQENVILCPPDLSSDSLVRMDESEFDAGPVRALLTVLPLALAVLRGVGVSFGDFGNREFVAEFSAAWIDSMKQKPIR